MTKLTLVLLILTLGAVSCSAPATTMPTEAAPPPQTTAATSPHATLVEQSSPDTGIQIIAQGEAMLTAYLNEDAAAESYLDLETGTVGDAENGDLILTLYAGSMVFYGFLPVNGGVSAHMGAAKPSLGDCWAELGNLSGNEVDLHQALTNVIPAYYTCLLTDEGHMSIIRTVRIAAPRSEGADDRGVGRVTVSFTTWGD